jgi:hypothetical protein
VVVVGTIAVDLISGAVRRRIVAGPTLTPSDTDAHPDLPPEAVAAYADA